MRGLTSILLLTLLFFFSACQTSTVVEESHGMFSNIGLTFENKSLVLKDVPLPQDFVMHGDSLCYGTKTFRYGEFLFRGTLSVDDIYFYYRKQMPTYGWDEDTSKIFETNAKLTFENRSELCTILCREGQQLTEVKIIIEQKKS